MSECYLTASEQFFRYIMAGTNKLRVAITWVHPWFSDGVRVAHPVVLCLFLLSLYCVLCGQCGQCLLYSFMIAFGFLCTVASVSALFIGFLCTVASVSALFIHDCLWFSLYCGQCLYFVHSWLPLVFSVLWPVSLLCSFMIAYGFHQRVCQWDDDDVCFVLDQHT